MKKLILEVELTEAEFLKFSLQRFYQSLAGKFFTILGLFLIFVPVLIFILKPEIVKGEFPFTQFILGLIFVLIIPLLIFRASKKTYFSNIQISEETQYTFDKEQVYLKGQTFNLNLKWQRIIQVTENDSFFLLFVTKQSCHILPKTQLNNNQILNLRNLISEIPNLKYSLFE